MPVKPTWSQGSRGSSQPEVKPAGKVAIPETGQPGVAAVTSHASQELGFRSSNKLICDTRRRPLCSISARCMLNLIVFVIAIATVLVIVFIVLGIVFVIVSVTVIVIVAGELPSETLLAELEQGSSVENNALHLFTKRIWVANFVLG